MSRYILSVIIIDDDGCYTDEAAYAFNSYEDATTYKHYMSNIDIEDLHHTYHIQIIDVESIHVKTADEMNQVNQKINEYNQYNTLVTMKKEYECIIDKANIKITQCMNGSNIKDTLHCIEENLIEIKKAHAGIERITETLHALKNRFIKLV